MDTDRRRALIEQYRGGVAAVELALAGITDDELDRAPAGEWSPRMVVHHLADSETSSYLRLRKLLAETDPVLQGYDEAEWARSCTTIGLVVAPEHRVGFREQLPQAQVRAGLGVGQMMHDHRGDHSPAE